MNGSNGVLSRAHISPDRVQHAPAPVAKAFSREGAEARVDAMTPLVREVRLDGNVEPTCRYEIPDKGRGWRDQLDRQDSVGVCAATRVWNISARRLAETRGPRL
jgi:hypothetical protein